jgi:hypothetical protein
MTGSSTEILERDGGPGGPETVVNGDSKSTNERGPFFDWFLGLVMPVQEIFVLHWLL